MNWEIGAIYKTRNGLNAVVTAIKDDDFFPLKAIIEDENGITRRVTYRLDGHTNDSNFPDNLDIVSEIVETPEVYNPDELI